MSREKKYIYAKKIWVKKYKINKNPLSPTKGENYLKLVWLARHFINNLNECETLLSQKIETVNGARGVAARKGRRTARVIIKCLVIITGATVFFSSRRIYVSRWSGWFKV